MKRRKHAPRMRLADVGQLQYAANLVASHRWEEAHDVVADFLERHPDSVPALELLLEICQETEDLSSIWMATWKLVKLRPNSPEAYPGLASASAASGHPFCALYYAQRYLEQWPEGEYASEVEEMTQLLEELCAKIQTDDPVAAGKALADLALLDQAHMLVSLGFYEEGRKVAEQAIERLPDIPAPLNNLSLAYATEGNLKEAVRAARQAMERFPDNIHARCNLIQFLVRSGNRTRRRVWQRLCVKAANFATMTG